MVITFRRVSVNLHHYQRTNGSCISESFGWSRHRIKTHKVTPSVGNERTDIEIKVYVILPRGEDNRLPPHTLMMDVTMTHDRYGRTTQHTYGTLTHQVSSTGPQSDGVLNNEARIKIRDYRQLYADRPDPIVFLPVVVNTSGRVFDTFVRLFFLYQYREASILAGELPEESEQFRFLQAARLANLKGSVGLILAKVSDMRVTIPIMCTVFRTNTNTSLFQLSSSTSSS